MPYAAYSGYLSSNGCAAPGLLTDGCRVFCPVIQLQVLHSWKTYGCNGMAQPKSWCLCWNGWPYMRTCACKELVEVMPE